jgi:hypothetical protein
MIVLALEIKDTFFDLKGFLVYPHWQELAGMEGFGLSRA